MTPVYTVGHSTRSIDELLELLRRHDVDLLVDVRRHPTSRRHSWFDREPLSRAVEEGGMEYRHVEVLGGRRGDPDPGSRNGGWRSPGFQAYADHLESPSAREALDVLVETTSRRVQALMCAELVPWRCHRQLIADRLVVRGLQVLHLVGPGDVQAHELNPMARILEDGRVVYPPTEPEQGELF